MASCSEDRQQHAMTSRDIGNADWPDVHLENHETERCQKVNEVVLGAVFKAKWSPWRRFTETEYGYFITYIPQGIVHCKKSFLSVSCSCKKNLTYRKLLRRLTTSGLRLSANWSVYLEYCTLGLEDVTVKLAQDTTHYAERAASLDSWHVIRHSCEGAADWRAKSSLLMSLCEAT